MATESPRARRAVPMGGDRHWDSTRPQVPAADAGPHGHLHTRPQSARFGSTWENDLRFSGSPRRPPPPPEDRFIVKMNMDPALFPKNYYGVKVSTPRPQPTVRPASARRPWAESSRSPRARPSSAKTPWGGHGGPLPWMRCPDGSMADDMNIVPLKFFKKQMQDAKDAAMADGHLSEQEKNALMDPRARMRAELEKTAAQISADQRHQHEYSDIFHRRPPPGLFYAEAIIQPSDPASAYKRREGDNRPRWQPAMVGGFDAPSPVPHAPAKGGKSGIRRASKAPSKYGGRRTSTMPGS